MPDTLDTLLRYHILSKHAPGRFAPGPGYLDWATQPDPFRKYAGAPVVPLEQTASGDSPPYDAGFTAGAVEPAPVTFGTISRFFFDSLSISAWKQAGGEKWALRVDPSSGNLHPTEGYLVCGPVPGLADVPAVWHYVSEDHALEQRAVLPPDLWRDLAAGLPEQGFFMALTSIYWRESWKYGERAFRYCNHDTGHAIAAAAIAAAGLGWRVRVAATPGTGTLERLLGTGHPGDAEKEEPDCLLIVTPGDAPEDVRWPDNIGDRCAALHCQGTPNRLSPDHVDWKYLREAAVASVKPETPVVQRWESPAGIVPPAHESAPPLRTIIRRRRSAMAMDGKTAITRAAFYTMLQQTMPRRDHAVLGALPWAPLVHFILFVHRVTGLEPGLYLLVRDRQWVEDLRAACRDEFEWAPPAACPADLPLYRLLTGDARSIAQQISCTQDIAGDSAFSLGMLARFHPVLGETGPWMYPRLYWECGLLGQILYLEAEAAGVRGTGIGCFFDDVTHDLLGLVNDTWQDLYHFTIGGPVDDPRLMSLPGYGWEKEEV